MIKAKVFSHESPVKLEEALNKWLSDNPGIEVLHATQTQVIDADAQMIQIVLTMFYKPIGS